MIEEKKHCIVRVGLAESKHTEKGAGKSKKLAKREAAANERESCQLRMSMLITILIVPHLVQTKINKKS